MEPAQVPASSSPVTDGEETAAPAPTTEAAAASATEVAPTEEQFFEARPNRNKYTHPPHIYLV